MKQHRTLKELALKEHILSGHPVTCLEGLVVFGIADVPRTITRLRRDGFLITTSKVPYVRALRRVNESAVLKPPQDFPSKELYLTEYQLSR